MFFLVVLFILWEIHTCHKRVASTNCCLQRSLKSTDNVRLRHKTDFTWNFLRNLKKNFFLFIFKAFGVKKKKKRKTWIKLEETIIWMKNLKTSCDFLIIIWQDQDIHMSKNVEREGQSILADIFHLNSYRYSLDLYLTFNKYLCDKIS